MSILSGMKATQLIKDDHEKARTIYQKLSGTLEPGPRAEAAQAFAEEVGQHAWLEERLVYPEFLHDHAEDTGVLLRFGQDHADLRRLLSAFRLAQEPGQAPGPEELELLAHTMAVLQQHVADEETRLLPLLEADPERDASLGAELGAVKAKLHAFPPIVQRLDVAAPLRRTYDLWTQFESFPEFLEDLKGVRQLDASHVRWQAQIAGKELQWTAEIYEQTPDRRIAWSSMDGARNTGSVTFQALGPERTRILLELTYEPRGVLEDLGALLDVLPRHVAKALAAFQEALEVRRTERGAWRGRIEGNPIGPNL